MKIHKSNQRKYWPYNKADTVHCGQHNTNHITEYCIQIYMHINFNSYDDTKPLR